MHPLVTSLPFIEPLSAAAALFSQPYLMWLDSSAEGRYSFMAADPFLCLQGREGRVLVNGKSQQGQYLDVFRQYWQRYRLDIHPALPPFQGGAMGFFSYEMACQFETIPNLSRQSEIPDFFFAFYDVVLAWDHLLKTCYLFSSGFPESGLAQLKRQQHRASVFQSYLEKKATIPRLEWPQQEVTSNFTRVGYLKAVQKARDYIHQGDIFEVNLSQRFSTLWPETVHPLSLYAALRQENPADFSAFVHSKKYALFSSSPERFLRLQSQEVIACPIKGTIARHLVAPEQCAHRLLSSEKNRAENIMIVDLLRNDLSRICEDDSVNVTSLCELLSLNNLYHLVSKIRGHLKPEYDAMDLLRATFPGGSITGAPKIRAMEIIAELERVGRGPYCGSIGYLGFNGDMDLSITIRTLVREGNQLSFHAGGAVVMDSLPEEEYNETLLKVNKIRQIFSKYAVEKIMA